MSKRDRRHHAPEQRAAVLKRHFVDNVPALSMCSKLQIEQCVFYKSQRDLLEAAPGLLAGPTLPEHGARVGSEGDRGGGAAPREDAIVAQVSEE